MGKVDNSAIAEVYAAALFDLAEARQQSEAIESELADLDRMLMEDADFRTFMQSPVVDSDHRGSVLEKLFRGKLSDTLLDTLQVLNQRGRMDCLSALERTYHTLLFARTNRVDVHVTSAVALDDGHRKQLADAVSKRIQKEAHLIERVDPELLGGLVIRIGDYKFDASVVNQLKRFHQSLKTRASNELHSGQNYVD